ncbi:Bax inhibitor-1/YccA family protein [Paenibacillus albiflavus]|nr:Bax inhibitor-1/YccA family protein [Paenibacillus albiflavus]
MEMNQQTGSYTEEGSLSHILRMFALSLLVSFIGMLLGALFVPIELVPLFIVIEVGMLIAAFIIRMRKKNIGYPFLFIFTAVTGVALYPVIEGYGSMIGANLVSGAFVATAAIFGTLAVYAARSKRDFSFMLGFLMAGTIGLIIMGLLSFFIPIGGAINLVWAVAGILIFSGWVLYDVSQYRDGVAPEEVPLASLNLFLNFINLFLYILRFIASIVGGRD